ncbi:BREX-1 system adenine-specific DNA-methyltransferase PglX [Pseudomonas aeruginosa]|uniref:BREX-1 system adenine-specific DNA-methyltransferase PglX n=1 Tax=Pseudomonas aeruginosa TaxID=287 RepID=UPI0029544F6E|nr:BREX-1 system adenine-specific DNA-methyltransferase PglX [Pseudomonas aeruginosa]MDV7888963.1 BREX-1 system adenine-specific DNA-methyltransferase PglX [Pseudomonas aeruginosa]
MSDGQSSRIKQGKEYYLFRASAAEFKTIPGSPIAYWASPSLIESFESGGRLGDKLDTAQGMKTLDNERFIRGWSEVSEKDITKAACVSKVWVPINHGGGFRKWYGFNESVINWKCDGAEIKSLAQEKYNSITRTVTGMGHYFENGITWSAISSEQIGVRKFGDGFIFTNAGMCAFGDQSSQLVSMALLNSKIGLEILKILAPSVNFGPNQISEIPIVDLGEDQSATIAVVKSLINISLADWNSFEHSLDFTSLPLLDVCYRHPTLKATYRKLRAHWREMTLEMQRLEQENNRIFIDAYGLKDELDGKVDLSEITLTCNPHYRYGGDKGEDELEAMLLADTLRELVSYAVGCMFGRYSLDKPGLILANQGETLADYLAQVPQPSFPADDDNVIPLLDGDWFPDDITLRFRQFLRVAFGDAHYEDNLAFIEQVLNVKGKRNFSLRDYFLGEFYADHVKRYKKRPIYWLFSSPKGTFSALVYLHRYRPDTVSVVLSYLRDFRKKLASRLDYLQQVAISTSASPSEKTKAIKEAEVVKKQLLELDDYERDTLYPLATEQVELDLDDGVKVNYLKLGAALKKIPGLEAKGED